MVCLWFGVRCSRAGLFFDNGRLDDAHTHIKHAMSHTVNDAYKLGGAVEIQTVVWYKQHRLEEARSEVLRTADIFEKLGAMKDLEERKFLQQIEEES